MPPLTIRDLVTLLTNASNAYYNGSAPIMDDDAFDTLVEQLRIRDPSNDFLKGVGAVPAEGVVPLPVRMPSLEKIKPGMKTLEKFLTASKNYVLSEKLDGLSGLWKTGTGPTSHALYLRGDGTLGQSITNLSKTISGLATPPSPCLVRGELVLAKSAVEPNQIARTIVNGLVHKSDPDPVLLGKVQFLAYEVLEPTGMKRSDQFKWLEANGFSTPWWRAVESPTEDQLKNYFTERRKGPIDIDGIVVGIDQVPIKPFYAVGSKDPARPPKDCVAFKSPLSDQSAITTVDDILWSASSHGYLIPRIRVDPVKIGGATIEYCTGHNARMIISKGLGPGATISIRRSGDVIPALDKVLFPAQPLLPRCQWEWIGDPETAIHIRSVDVSNDQLEAQFVLFAKTLDIPGVGPGTAKGLVEAGIRSVSALWSQTEAQLAGTLGPKTGASLYKNLREKLPSTSELKLMVASSKLPRSVGETKLTTLFQVAPDPRQWLTTTTIPVGWSHDSFQAFKDTFHLYETWRRTELAFLEYPLNQAKPQAEAKVEAPPAYVQLTRSGRVCFTGFRDTALESRARKVGFEVVWNVYRDVKHLVISDRANVTDLNSEKLKKAFALGTVEVIKCSDFITKYLT